MPYNNAPIAPPEEITGSSALPLARVKKIIAMDEDIAQCSNSAAFAISVATEIFIRYLTEQAYNFVKAERKPRRNIAYKDLANAVARIDNLEFLADVVPRTKTYRQFKEEAAQEEAAKKAAKDRPSSASNGVNGEVPKHTIDLMMQRPPESTERPRSNGFAQSIEPRSPPILNGSPIVDRTVQHQPHAHPGSAEDSEMTG